MRKGELTAALIVPEGWGDTIGRWDHLATPEDNQADEAGRDARSFPRVRSN